jgi:hypothetical protein
MKNIRFIRATAATVKQVMNEFTGNLLRKGELI